MESEGRKLHELAAKAREDGDHLKALQLEDEAMLAYQRDGDKLGLAEVVADRSIVLRHLWEGTGDKNFLMLAEAEMEASVKIARESGETAALALPLFNLAKTQEDLGNLQEAVKSYADALHQMETNPPATHNRPAVVADFKVHLATCEYRAGDKSALERAEIALSDLEQTDEVKYNRDVWVSGGHMRIANMLKDDNPDKAKEHLQKAKEIIDSNPDLKIRRQQWEKLEATFS